MDQPYDCKRVVEIEQEPRHHLVFANEFVRGFAVEIAAHERSLCHHHPNDYLLYVASGADIVSAARDEEPKKLSYSDGECELLEAGLVHVVENLGDKPFRNVVVELLPAAAALRRGAAPKSVARETNALQLLEEPKVTQVFDDERAAVFSIEIGLGAEFQVSGPAVVAVPNADSLSPAIAGDVHVKFNDICDLAWISPGQTAGLRGCWDGAEQAVVFQIGCTDEQGSPVVKVREPLRSLHAHADEPE